MFEKASRMKLRFDTLRGRLSVEDLWELPLIGGDICLDEIAKHLHRNLKDSEEESFVVKTTKANAKLELQFEIVKHIIAVRIDEKEAAENAKAIREKKQKILAIIAEKETENLKDSSVDDLKKLLESL